jgi:hypothetical protein
MFGVTKRFSAKKAASMLRKHRSELRRDHKNLRALLRRRSHDPNGSELSEQIARLQRRHQECMRDGADVCSQLVRRVSVISLFNYADALIANSRLNATCQEVAMTIQKLVPKQNTGGD